MSDGDPRESVTMLLGYWDAYNLKTILRGKQFLLSPEEIVRSLIPAGYYDEPALWELARQPSLRAVAELLLTWRTPHAAPSPPTTMVARLVILVTTWGIFKISFMAMFKVLTTSAGMFLGPIRPCQAPASHRQVRRLRHAAPDVNWQKSGAPGLQSARYQSSHQHAPDHAW